jgi:hypothetical protein
MSEIFSFRLSKSNPREARAIEILQANTNEGISLRQLITDGLLALASRPSKEEVLPDDIQSLLHLILNILNKEQMKKVGIDRDGLSEISTKEISEQFIFSIKRDIKKGMNL